MQFDLFGSPEKYLAKLRSDWRNTIENDGGHCPCCDRWGKVSPQSMSETMALALLWLSRADADVHGWVDVPKSAPRWMLRGKTYTTMARWGLIEKGSREDASKKSDGYWRVTAKGWAFLRGQVSVPQKVYTYNNTVEGYSEKVVYFRDCFGKYFDYETVMGDNFNLNAIRI